MESKKNSRMKQSLMFFLLFFLLYLSFPVYSLRIYRVSKGDTVWRISRRFKISVSSLKRLNNLKNSRIFKGMSLKIPGRVSRRVRTAKKRYYRVRHGDTVWSICRKFSISKRRFIKINSMSSVRIYPGQLVNVSGHYKSVSAKSIRWRWYRVRKGDSLWKISRRYRVSLISLKRLNRSRIYPGQRIKLPIRKFGKRPVRRSLKRKRWRKSYNRQSRRYFGRIPRNRRIKLIWPVPGKVVSYFGIKKSGINNGIVIKTPRSRQIKAAYGGRVIWSGRLRGYGNMVMIRHSNSIYSVYAGTNKLFVKKGASVRKGAIIASTGLLNGRSIYGLSFQVYYKDKPVNPLNYLQR